MVIPEIRIMASRLSTYRACVEAVPGQPRLAHHQAAFACGLPFWIGTGQRKGVQSHAQPSLPLFWLDLAAVPGGLAHQASPGGEFLEGIAIGVYWRWDVVCPPWWVVRRATFARLPARRGVVS
ncbi:hypothetical protein ABW21_db0204039 [Orbilia brochopaga]|nr:hypothetical protein ABW21_db0204039 [Drechslerella brochopaga]